MKKSLLLLLFMLLLTACGSGAGKQGKDAESVAEETIKTVYSCTSEDVAAFDACLHQQTDGGSGGETGISSGSESLEAFFGERVGSVMSESCISECLGARVLSMSIDLSRQHGEGVEAENFVLNERTGGDASYTYSLDLVGADSKEVFSSVTGTITLVEENGSWMTKSLSCNR